MENNNGNDNSTSTKPEKGFLKRVKETTDDLKSILENMEEIWKYVRKFFFGTVAAIGIAGDFLKPLYDFMPYVVGGGILLLILGILFILLRKAAKTLMTIFTALGLLTAALFFSVTPYEGLLSTRIEKVNDAQVHIAENLLKDTEKAKVIKLRRNAKEIIKDHKKSPNIDPKTLDKLKEIYTTNPEILERNKTLKEIPLEQIRRIDPQNTNLLDSIKINEKLKASLIRETLRSPLR